MERRMKRLNIDASKARATDNGAGGMLEGHASAFGNVDLQGDIIQRGAFAKTISERIPARKIKLMAQHAGTTNSVLDVIGTVTEATEDEAGLYIKADFADTQAAQDVRKLVKGQHVSGLSVGFWVMDGEPLTGDSGGMLIKEAKLEEVTVTAFPANELARITASKSLQEYEKALSEIEQMTDDVARADAVRRLRSELVDGNLEKAIARLKTLEAPRQTTANSAGIYEVRAQIARARLRLQTLMN